MISIPNDGGTQKPKAILRAPGWYARLFRDFDVLQKGIFSRHLNILVSLLKYFNIEIFLQKMF